MTDDTVPPGKADLPFAVRLRIQQQRLNEIRDGILRRYYEVIEQDRALAGAHLAAEIEIATGLAAYRAKRVAPAVPAVPAPVAPDLRAQLGLT